MRKYVIKPCGDAALMIQFEQKIDPAILREVRQLTEKIQNAHLKGVIDLIPSYAALLVKFDPAVFSVMFSDVVGKKICDKEAVFIGI